jgi:hypothetical protein
MVATADLDEKKMSLTILLHRSSSALLDPHTRDSASAAAPRTRLALPHPRERRAPGQIGRARRPTPRFRATFITSLRRSFSALYHVREEGDQGRERKRRAYPSFLPSQRARRPRRRPPPRFAPSAVAATILQNARPSSR